MCIRDRPCAQYVHAPALRQLQPAECVGDLYGTDLYVGLECARGTTVDGSDRPWRFEDHAYRGTAAEFRDPVLPQPQPSGSRRQRPNALSGIVPMADGRGDGGKEERGAAG